MKVRIVWTPIGRPAALGNLISGTRQKLIAGARQENVELEAPPRALVDIHSHILWGLDDGSRDLSESLAMLEMAYARGTTDIVATPHANYRYKFDSGIIAERVAELRALMPSFPRIHLGCDFHLNVHNVEDALANPHKYTINGLNYLMTEFPDLIIPTTSEEILRLLIEAGITPVITHPERNQILQGSLERLEEWVSMGCLLQVTGQSLSGGFGRKAQEVAWQLLTDRLVHVIASDAHDTTERPPRLDLAWKAIKHKMGEAVATSLFIDNPSAIIAGRPIPVPEAMASKGHSAGR